MPGPGSPAQATQQALQPLALEPPPRRAHFEEPSEEEKDETPAEDVVLGFPIIDVASPKQPAAAAAAGAAQVEGAGAAQDDDAADGAVTDEEEEAFERRKRHLRGIGRVAPRQFKFRGGDLYDTFHQMVLPDRLLTPWPVGWGRIDELNEGVPRNA